MRPEVLFPLFKPIVSLKGVGPRNAQLIARVAGERVVDLCWCLPTGLTDRTLWGGIAEAPTGRTVSLKVEVREHRPSGDRRRPYRVICGDPTGELELVFFHARPDYLERALPTGARRIVSGRLEYFQDRPQMAHPDLIVTEAEFAELPKMEPVYGLTKGLAPKAMARAVRGAVEQAPALPDWLEPSVKQRHGWPDWLAALRAAHAPQGPDDLEAIAPARQRLAYDELLANQLALMLVRRRLRRQKGRAIRGSGSLAARAAAALPYDLTGAQARAIREILADMGAPLRMLRLLQGDVGSGKTVVAFFAMLAAVEAGCQAALMAPTEILARQHAATLGPLCEAVGLRLEVLTGRDKGKAREAILEGLRDGSVPMLVGTHALLQGDVEFKDLALAVVDEQHRFGVYQRLALSDKGGAVDVLVMTATPIPRTLALTVYGDMESSALDEKPPGRRPVDTRAIPLDRLEDVVGAVGRAIEGGDRVYWVCPLVEESDQLDVSAAEDRHAVLKQRFGDAVGLLHGRMAARDKDRAMAAFLEGGTRVLVATTVIEVGVDAPDATVIVIEHAERFGLAQLHQLRGRVGRGRKPGTCLLLYAAPLGETARARLRVLRETDDGFRIAEEDLRLRGAGEVLGTRQSGLPEFRLADLAVHGDLMVTARDDARLALERDAELQSDRGKALRVLLYLFDRDQAVRLLRSG